MNIIESKPVPKWEQVCEHCKSVFTFEGRETTYKATGIFGNAWLDCPVCEQHQPACFAKAVVAEQV